MKLAKGCYTHYGHQCRRCGGYAVYTDDDLAKAAMDGDVMDDKVSVRFYCPYCDSPFVHNLDDPSIDIEPDAHTLAALKKAGEEADPVLIAPLSVGDEAYLAYDEYYAKNGGNLHHWVATTKPNIVKSVSYEADKDETTLEYKFEDIVYAANDPRQHCRETFHSCVAFPTETQAREYANKRNGRLLKEDK